MLGRYFKSRPDARSQVFLATKFSFKNDNTENDSSPEYIKLAIEQSLRKLETDHIDLYYWRVPIKQVCMNPRTDSKLVASRLPVIESTA